MDELRDPKVVLREAELLASSPETVAEWLRGRNRWSVTDPADDALETNLLERKERRIDLALARYGQCDAVLQELFGRGDEILRAATLANENIYSVVHPREFPFLDPEICDFDFSWMSELSDLELKALFSNPALPPSLIMSFFRMEKVWQVLSEGQRKTAAWRLSQNMRQWPDTFSWSDDTTWESRRLDAVASAWEFADKIEMVPPWPYFLAGLYEKLGFPSYIRTDPLQMAARWTNPDDEEEAKEKNGKGYLTYHQSVRCSLGRLAAGRRGLDKKALSALIAHDDIAIRCGAYLVGDLSTEQVKVACKNDEKLACSHLIYNKNVWKKADNWYILEKACKEFSEGQDWVISLTRNFYRQRDLMNESHPEWFKQDEWVGDDLKERPLTESSIDELVDRVTSSQAFFVLEKSIDRMHATATTRFWVLIAILAVIAFKI